MIAFQAVIKQLLIAGPACRSSIDQIYINNFAIKTKLVFNGCLLEPSSTSTISESTTITTQTTSITTTPTTTDTTITPVTTISSTILPTNCNATYAALRESINSISDLYDSLSQQISSDDLGFFTVDTQFQNFIASTTVDVNCANLIEQLISPSSINDVFTQCIARVNSLKTVATNAILTVLSQNEGEIRSCRNNVNIIFKFESNFNNHTKHCL